MIRVSLIIFLLFESAVSLSSQNISFYEWRWAVFHPVAAIKVKVISKKCSRIYNDESTRRQLDYFVYGGKLDAFRHVYFMAACARKVKVKKLRKLGGLHEKTNYRMFLRSKKEYGESADSLGSVMDLYNNEVGFKIGSANKKTDLNSLKEIVISAIHNGEALYMKRNKAGNYLDCEGKEIEMEKYRGLWSLPKCLISTNL